MAACSSDAMCDDGLFCTGVERCTAGRCVNEAVTCDDDIACTADTCSEAQDRCVNEAPDRDGDGARDAACVDTRGAALGDDCDDANPTRFPGNLEICDALGNDEDCVASTLGGIDADDDTFESSACCVREAGGALRCGPDCDDAVSSTHPTSSEVCNGVDDDCDMRVDDIIDGNVICRAGQTRPCTTSCGPMGSQLCNDSCLGWDTCTATEICNGCDDNNNGAADDGFECVRGASSACTTSCGTTGVRLCGDACTYQTCVASEECNYCDDDGDGNIFEERPLATFTANSRLESCGTPFGPATSCYDEPTARGFDVWTQILDGTANNQAGATWFEPGWTMGWGPIELDITLEVRAVTAGGGVEMPLGGWAVVLGRSGATGVGTPQASGIPTTVEGVAARWFWSQFDSCYMPSRPPASVDSVRAAVLLRGAASPLVGSPSAPDGSCFSGDNIAGGATQFDGPASGTVTQRIQLRYTPDDPTTASIREESISITATSGAGITRTYQPIDSVLPPGAGPLRIGITAGTYTRNDFTGTAPGLRFGVPVRARARVFRQDDNCCGPPTFTYPMTVVRRSICP